MIERKNKRKQKPEHKNRSSKGLAWNVFESYNLSDFQSTQQFKLILVAGAAAAASRIW